jgi:carboxyl-terminal processing protease
MLTLEEKIFGLSLIWKEAEYNFPFWKRLGTLDWDSEYRNTLPKVMAAESLREYYLELSRFISLLQDGHTGVWFPPEVYAEAGKMPVSIGLISGKWCAVNSDISLGMPLYDEILFINDLPISQYINQTIYPYCWHEKEDSASWQINNLLPLIEYKKEISLITMSGSYNIRAVNDQITWHKKEAMKANEKLTELFSSKTHFISLTDDNIAVISIPTFMENAFGQEFYENMTNLRDCRGYIIDVRNNGGGNSDNADYVVQAFVDGEFICSTDRKMLHIGSYKAWGKYQNLEEIDQSNPWNKKLYDICKRQYFENSTDKKKIECPFTLTAPLVVLENEGTASSAEDMLVAFDVTGRATIMGTPSYGSTGMPLIFDLPGGGGGRICTRWCTYPDGKDFINVGVVPQVNLEPSLDDLRNRYDRVLDKGIAILRDKIKNL